MSTAKNFPRGDAFLRYSVYTSLFFSICMGVLAFSPGWLVAFGTAVLALFWSEWRSSASQERKERRTQKSNPRAEEIDALYRELRQLLELSPEGSEQVERTFARLRALQREEAAEMRKRFEASLTLSTADGLSAIREARRLLGRDENPASSNPAPIQQG